MIINLFKTTKPKNYKLDERECLNLLRFNDFTLFVFRIMLCLTLVIIAYNKGVSLFNLELPLLNITSELIITMFISVFVIAPFIAIKNDAAFYSSTYIMGLLAGFLISNPIDRVLKDNELTALIVHMSFTLFIYVLYVIYYNKKTHR